MMRRILRSSLVCMHSLSVLILHCMYSLYVLTVCTHTPLYVLTVCTQTNLLCTALIGGEQRLSWTCV
jgi:hypothetical protein